MSAIIISLPLQRDADFVRQFYVPTNIAANIVAMKICDICDMILLRQGFNQMFPSQQERVSDDTYNKRRQFIYDRAYPRPYPTILFYLKSHEGIEEFVISETARFETYIGMKEWEAFVNAVVNLIRFGFLEWNGPCLKVSKYGENEIVTRICTGEIKVPSFKGLA